MPFLASEGCFWPLTASMTSEVKKNHAHVYPYRNLRNFSEINFSIGPMVWPWIALWLHQDFVGLLIRFHFDSKNHGCIKDILCGKIFLFTNTIFDICPMCDWGIKAKATRQNYSWQIWGGKTAAIHHVFSYLMTCQWITITLLRSQKRNLS